MTTVRPLPIAAAPPAASCPPWCVAVHLDDEGIHWGADHETVASTEVYRLAGAHLAGEALVAAAGLPAAPVPPATIISHLLLEPGGGPRIWVGLDHSNAGYELIPREARVLAGHLLALADAVGELLVDPIR